MSVKDDVNKIANEHPELVTSDISQHLQNVLMYGTSILLTTEKDLGKAVYGKSPVQTVLGVDPAEGPDSVVVGKVVDGKITDVF